MSAADGFFAPPARAPADAPPPHVGRVELLRTPEARTHWHPTVTTFGPLVKVPISVFLVCWQLIRIIRAVRNGTFLGGPPLAFELSEVVIYYTVVALLLKAMWASGKRDGRRLGR